MSLFEGPYLLKKLGLLFYLNRFLLALNRSYTEAVIFSVITKSQK